MIKGKMILAAAVLAALAGGYQGFAENAEAEYVISGAETLTDAVLAKNDSPVKNSYYTGTNTRCGFDSYRGSEYQYKRGRSIGGHGTFE